MVEDEDDERKMRHHLQKLQHKYKEMPKRVGTSSIVD